MLAAIILISLRQQSLEKTRLAETLATTQSALDRQAADLAA